MKRRTKVLQFPKVMEGTWETFKQLKPSLDMIQHVKSNPECGCSVVTRGRGTRGERIVTITDVQTKNGFSPITVSESAWNDWDAVFARYVAAYTPKDTP